MTCTSITVSGQPTQQGLKISASKLKDSKPFATTIHIEGQPGQVVDGIVWDKLGGNIPDECIVQNITLDSNGEADVELQVSQTMTIYATSGLGCCTAQLGQCENSNKLKLIVGSDWSQAILPAAVLIGGAILLYGMMKGRD